MRRSLVFVGLGTLISVACTPEQVYDSARALRVDECQKLAQPEQEECMRQTHEPYSEQDKKHEEPEQRR